MPFDLRNPWFAWFALTAALAAAVRILARREVRTRAVLYGSFLIGCLALSAPRFAILIVVFFSNYIGRAYQTTLVPFIGFLLMPLTTLAVTIAPDHLHPEGGCRIGIPRVRRLERDRRCRNINAINSELVHFRVRLVDANLLD